MRTPLPRLLTTVSALGLLPALPLLPGIAGPESPTPAALAAQERPLPPPTPPVPRVGRGWLGIGFEVTTRRPPGREGMADTIRVRSVIPGSPAEAAGIRRGDLLTHLQGEEATGADLDRMVAGLEPGSQVHLRLLREGLPVEVALEASARPDLVLNRPSGEVTVIFLDSLRTRMGAQADTIRAFLRMNVDSLRARGFLLEEEAQRLAEDAVRRGGAMRLRGEAMDLRGEAMGTEGRSLSLLLEARRRTPEGEVPSRIILGGPFPGPVLEVGRRVMAGAEVTPLNPGLGRYFGTDEGILVTEVVEGTPAHAAGLRPGDVVVEAAGDPVRSVADLRGALERGYRSPPVPLRILREGAPLTLELPR